MKFDGTMLFVFIDNALGACFGWRKIFFGPGNCKSSDGRFFQLLLGFFSNIRLSAFQQLYAYVSCSSIARDCDKSSFSNICTMV